MNRFDRLERQVEGNLDEAMERTFAGDYAGAEWSLNDARANLRRLRDLEREEDRLAASGQATTDA